MWTLKQETVTKRCSTGYGRSEMLSGLAVVFAESLGQGLDDGIDGKRLSVITSRLLC